MISIKFRVGAIMLDRARLSFALCDGSYYHKAFEINLPLSLHKIMTLIRLIQRVSLLSSLVVTSLIIHGSPARSDQRVCIITDDGATMCGKPTSSKKEAKNPKQQNSGYRKEVGNFVYLLKGCKKSDTSVKCEFVITNKAAERGLTLWADNPGFTSTTIVDSTGKSYRGSTIDIGGQRNSSVSLSIAPGIDYEATLTFENIPDRVVKASLMNFYADNNKILQFRNVPF
jgi:hypothetical protein